MKLSPTSCVPCYTSKDHHKIPVATNTARHMSMLCYGVDITLMDTCVSVTCSNMHHTTDFFSEGSDWYFLRLQLGNTFPDTWHVCTLQNVIKHRKSPFGHVTVLTIVILRYQKII